MSGGPSASLASMPAVAHEVDLAGMRLRPGEGRRLRLTAPLCSIELGGERYEPQPRAVDADLEVSRLTGSGYALRLVFDAAISGPCMRCLMPARPEIHIDVREVDVPGGGEDLDSPYVSAEMLDLDRWAHDALLLAAPTRILCKPDCKGLCPVCAANLNEASQEHSHERAPDPRWAKLRELELE